MGSDISVVLSQILSTVFNAIKSKFLMVLRATDSVSPPVFNAASNSSFDSVHLRLLKNPSKDSVWLQMNQNIATFIM